MKKEVKKSKVVEKKLGAKVKVKAERVLGVNYFKINDKEFDVEVPEKTLGASGKFKHSIDNVFVVNGKEVSACSPGLAALKVSA